MLGNGSSTTLLMNNGEPRYQASGAKTIIRSATAHQYRFSSLRMAASHFAPLRLSDYGRAISCALPNITLKRLQ